MGRRPLFEPCKGEEEGLILYSADRQTESTVRRRYNLGVSRGLNEMDQTYVEKRDGGYCISGTRVSLDSIVYAFRRGASPETIKSSFPAMTLEQVYGAITYYLSKQTEIDEYLRQSEEAYEAARQANHEQLHIDKPALYERLTRAKDERRTTQR